MGARRDTAAVLAAQKALIPNLGDPTFTCVDIDGSSVTATCVAGMQVKVVILAPYQPVTPVLSLIGTIDLEILEHVLDPAMKTAGARSMSANVPTASRDSERGQIIVVFALALVAIIAMVGLVLDGGSAFAMRRDEQSAADMAALAAANDYVLNSDSTLAIARARTVAAANGYQHGTNGVIVNVLITTSNGAEATVDISAPHRNNFASIVGMPNWTVATTAMAQSGYPDTCQRRRPDHLQHRRIRPEWDAAGGLRRQGQPIRLR